MLYSAAVPGPTSEVRGLSLIFLLVAVVAPSVIVFIMNGIEALVEAMGRTRRSMKVGWDLCVLGLGAAGSITMDGEVLSSLGTTGVVLAASGSVIVSLGSAVAIAHMRRAQNPGRLQAAIALVLGAIALTVPAYLALQRP